MEEQHALPWEVSWRPAVWSNIRSGLFLVLSISFGVLIWQSFLQILKRRLLSPINSQKLNVCIEFVFPAAGETHLAIVIFFSGMLWLSYVTDNPDLCVAILSIRCKLRFLITSFRLDLISHHKWCLSCIDQRRLDQSIELWAHLAYLVSVLGHAACWISHQSFFKIHKNVFFSFFFNGAIYSGHTMTGLAMAPNRFPMCKCMPLNELWKDLLFRSGTVMGLSNGFGSIAGIIVPPVKVIHL